VNDTSVAMGIGLKFNRVVVDGVLSTATTQLVDASQLLSQVAVTYNF
jgi:hypothetical protein